MLTYKSLISNVIILWFLSIFSCVKSLARAVESLTMLWFRKWRLFSLFTSNFDILFAGASLLLTAGLTGWLGLCSLIWALRSGGWQFFWVRFVLCFLLMIRSTMLWGLGDKFLVFVHGIFLRFLKVLLIKEVVKFFIVFVNVYDDIFYPYQLWLPLHFPFKVCCLCFLGYKFDVWPWRYGDCRKCWFISVSW